MAIWYQANIIYFTQDERGRIIKNTEVYLVDSVSYTDAEARIYEIIQGSNPDFQLKKLAKVQYNEVFKIESEIETWFKVKVNFVSFDEKSQKEKLIPFTFLLNTTDIVSAVRLITEKLGTVEDYHITEVSKTNVFEVHFS